jgi:branched-chain amino acid transport system ATP-binding protein
VASRWPYGRPSRSSIVYVMDHGELIASGPPQDVVRNERVVEAYLGRRH